MSSERFALFSRSADSGLYLELSREPFGNGPEGFLRTPGYPLLISGVRAAFPGGGDGPLLYLQILAWCIAVASACIIASAAVEGSWPFVAVLSSLDLASLGSSLSVLTETCFAACLGCGFAFLARAQLHPGWQRAVTAGLFLGAATLVRPITVYLPIALGLALLMAGRRAGLRRRDGLLLVVVAAIIPGVWQVRNSVEFGCAQLSAIESVNVAYHRAATALALAEDLSLAEARLSIAQRSGHTIDPANTGTLYQLRDCDQSMKLMKTGIAVLASHPVASARGALAGMAALLSPGHERISRMIGGERYTSTVFGAMLRRGPFVALQSWYKDRSLDLALGIIAAGNVALLGLGIVLVLLQERGIRSPITLVLLVGIAYFVLLSSGPETTARFRSAFAPLLWAAAAIGWARFAGRRLAGAWLDPVGPKAPPPGIGDGHLNAVRATE